MNVAAEGAEGEELVDGCPHRVEIAADYDIERAPLARAVPGLHRDVGGVRKDRGERRLLSDRAQGVQRGGVGELGVEQDEVEATTIESREARLKVTHLSHPYAPASPHGQEFGDQSAVELIVLDDENFPGAWHGQRSRDGWDVLLASAMARSVTENRI
jgi:hypothetical protein